MRRLPGLRLLATALVGGLLLTGCTAPRPEVTFYGNRSAVEAGPALWCQVNTADLQFECPTIDPAHYVRLTLRPGDPVQINVPSDIGRQPWQVAFQYANAEGTVVEARTALFTAGQLAYTLQPVAATDRLLHVEVQTGLLPTADGVVVTRSWVLDVKAIG